MEQVRAYIHCRMEQNGRSPAGQRIDMETLLDGGLREANLRESSGKIAEANADLRGVEEQIRDLVRKARGELETAEVNLATAEERVKLAVESARLAKESFDAGASTYLQVTDVNATLAGAQLSSVAEALNVQLS
ncbi:TolC family protein [Myxococcus faecalis]